MFERIKRFLKSLEKRMPWYFELPPMPENMTAKQTEIWLMFLEMNK